MNILEIFHTINAGQIGWYISWEDFLQRLGALREFLVERQDGTYMFFHPSFREWLIHRSENETKKFLCDPRLGEAVFQHVYQYFKVNHMRIIINF